MRTTGCQGTTWATGLSGTPNSPCPVLSVTATNKSQAAMPSVPVTWKMFSKDTERYQTPRKKNVFGNAETGPVLVSRGSHNNPHKYSDSTQHKLNLSVLEDRTVSSRHWQGHVFGKVSGGGFFPGSSSFWWPPASPGSLDL